MIAGIEASRQPNANVRVRTCVGLWSRGAVGRLPQPIHRQKLKVGKRPGVVGDGECLHCDKNFIFHRKQDVSEAERPIKDSATGIFNDETCRIG